MDKKDEVKYHEQKYGTAEKEVSPHYSRKEETREKDKDKNNNVFEDLEEGKKGKLDIPEDELPVKAARQLFNETRLQKNDPKQDAETKTIEDAIKKAIEEEKQVIIMD